MRRTPAVLVILALLMLAQGAARGAELPAGLTAKQELADADKRALRDFAEPLLTALAAKETGPSQQAREDLLAPLRSGVSVAFRLEFSGAVMPTVSRLASGPDERVAFNALRIAGALATDDAMGAIRAALADARPSVRYGGAFGARRALDEVASKRFSPDAAQVGRLVEAMTEQLKKESEPGVVEGLVSAFDAVGPDGATRSAALASMCAAVSAQAASFGEGKAGAPESWAYAFQRSVKVAQAALVEQGRVGNLDESLAKGGANMCGQLLAHVVRRLQSFTATESREAETAALQDLASAAEGTLIFIDANLTKRTPPQQVIRAAFPDAAKVATEAGKWVGPKGLLSQPPYSFKPLLP